MVPSTASRRLICPWITLSHAGAKESSKSAMKTLTLAFKALMIILRSTGPVISTRRSRKSAGTPRIVQAFSRMCSVSGRKSGNAPASICAWNASRAASNCGTCGAKRVTSSARKSNACGVRMACCSAIRGSVQVSSGCCAEVLCCPLIPFPYHL